MAKKNKSEKGKNMIERMSCFAHGEVGQRTLDNIKDALRGKVREALIMFDRDKSGVVKECYYGWLNINLFDKGTIALNNKNIEYNEKFFLVKGYGNDSELANALHDYRIEDVLIDLIVYRIGSYSYWMAIPQVMSPDHPE